MVSRLLAVAVLFLLTSSAALAAPHGAFDGAELGWAWALPFVGILLTIATGPLLFTRVWHHHYDKLALAWGAATLLPIGWLYGPQIAGAAFVHAALGEYLSFIVLIFALYVVAGGILVTGSLRGTPSVNTIILTFGTVIASVVGTTGAAMILIRPLLRANAHRPSNAHVVVFFIFLVCNIGGALSPLGDPPLFIGFLRGVSFFWTTEHLWLQTLCVSAALLAVFAVIDIAFARREPAAEKAQPIAIQVHGLINLVLIALIIAAILGSAIWRPEVTFDVYGTPVELQNLLRDAALVVVALLSLWLTPDEHREANGFSFEPIREVAILFAAIFICIIPVMAMLQAGADGRFAPLLAAVTTPGGEPHNVMYFWLTGMLSGFLDNAPTYLVFFGLAGGDATTLMTTLAPTLAAISMGAVYMGALTYIGNAPNFMVYAIASERGVHMPGFFGYMAWSFGILIPLFILLSWLGV
ncbi:sodium:proton antiporter [Bradyrhizobium sp. U87765 SZCCT0131]|uniref:sodium:proton antiporter n=1 Tax=unclassified Bradyrhizobium TaxID=2631580 RepID=UPI001BAD209D|nr:MULTISPECIES: sodium:proton antiporter [unclassified Bradyrhizobium]MBR1217373.1 sodium:proton antiporter [Bradyrhizobium sp. U87765 SZCCT0131]MBR1265030.1 sodium:proton antiporter [Bradyrhizobium sp. U87765 SZCCT0134]MBR1305012.1 sodium:proton antiporter [Bradyrhizobium sp. U87765 SZCCT0110]MBR1320798.1 sodium:proton antiporter [Bradyrhizobium sp. U87765 SZCCT0109]MBR1349218.1 sodium:proton antiporter [Bradyrhizobium sp. U87765 SZCCT0048]